ncbi:MAG TPA: DUF4908 domain-containing protein [Vitreimonas sp.]|uniref:DUF4908 domain-containing protein n=1 Tax=Vitreimonas sp. TaxID=3069702 RepID=UPI002D6391BE|nr:DUF4908 domain-containing protein [Vitreimonas sp.]HYD89431.1 DUF4908 domain-containing protein [Vitreimonas sp.]
MSQSTGPSLKGRGAAAFAAALALAAPGLAFAQQQPRQSAPPVQGLYTHASNATRYSTPDGAVRFVLDRTGGRAALVRFEGDPEVHVLRPAMAAGGGEIYRTEDGDVMLRITPHGGIIVYTRTLRTGAPASEEARVAPLTPEAIAFAEMQERFRRLQAVARRSVGAPVTFTVPARMSAPAAGVVVDAAERAAEGLAAAPMTTVRRVIITFGPQPRVVMRGDQLLIQVAPQLGYAGRPSSNTIRNVVTGEIQGPQQ